MKHKLYIASVPTPLPPPEGKILGAHLQQAKGGDLHGAQAVNTTSLRLFSHSCGWPYLEEQ
jgi:hypothetical protein